MMCNKFKVAQEVIYEGKETFVDYAFLDGTYKIKNPDYDWDFESELISKGIDCDIPFWIIANESELKEI